MSGFLSGTNPPRLGAAGVSQVGQGWCAPSLEKAGPLPASAAAPAQSGLQPSPSLKRGSFLPSTKQLELWFSSLQEDAGQRLKWERMGLLGYKGGGEGKGSVCWFPLMPE